jgi:hypothetical protein
MDTAAQIERCLSVELPKDSYPGEERLACELSGCTREPGTGDRRTDG